MATTPAHRNIAAEVRAVEEGHRALAHPEGGVRVVSDTRPGKSYRVTFPTRLAVGEPIRFTCDPEGTAAYTGDHLHTVGEPGALPCKHAALAARRLEREGLVRLSHAGDRFNGWPLAPGLWITTDKAAVEPDDGDPFDGLPT